MTTNAISIKVSNLRKISNGKGRKYTDLKDWLSNDNNVYTGRFGRIFIKTGNESKIFHYKQSKWANPYSLKEYSLSESLNKYVEHLLKFNNNNRLIYDIFELDGKTLGCFCDKQKNGIIPICHAQILTDLLTRCRSTTLSVIDSLKLLDKKDKNKDKKDKKEKTDEKEKEKIDVNNVIYVDGGHNKFTKDEAWASVVDSNGVDLIPKYKDLLSDMTLKNVKLPKGPRMIIVSKFDDVKSQQNNGAELLAMVAGLRIMIKEWNNKKSIINSDSQLIVDYWSVKLKNINIDKRKKKYIEECIELRKKFKGEIKKISGDDNIADLGFHK